MVKWTGPNKNKVSDRHVPGAPNISRTALLSWANRLELCAMCVMWRVPRQPVFEFVFLL